MNIDLQLYDDFQTGRLDSLYTEAWASLLSYAARLLGKEYAMLAEDCVQESILKIYHNRQTLTSPFQLKAFLFTYVHNQCVSILRKADTQRKYLDQLPVSEADLTASIIEQETIDLLIQAIEKLPPDYKAIFTLNFEEGLKNEEAARQLNISLSSFNKRKAKMMGPLRRQFGNQLLTFVGILV